MACGNNVEFFVRHQLHVFREPVAASWNGDDELVILRTLAERLAQEEDVPAQVGFFDERIWPDCFQQVVFGDDLLVVTDENQQDLKSLGRDGDGFVFAQQQVLLRIKAEGAELVELPGLRVCACGHEKAPRSGSSTGTAAKPGVT